MYTDFPILCYTDNVMSESTPVAPAVPQDARSATRQQDTKGKKKKGGCLSSVLILALLIGAATLWLLRVPQKMGWVKNASAEMISLSPERLTSEEMVLEAKEKGFKDINVEVYVFPRPGTDESSLLAVYDFSKRRVEFSRVSERQPVIDTMLLLGSGKKAEEHKVTYIGLEFHDERGKFLLSASASTEDVRALRDGNLTEEEFRKRMGVRADLPNYVRRSLFGN